MTLALTIHQALFHGATVKGTRREDPGPEMSQRVASIVCQLSLMEIQECTPRVKLPIVSEQGTDDAAVLGGLAVLALPDRREVQ